MLHVSKIVEALESFLGHPVFLLASAIVLAVCGARMTQQTGTFMLVGAWALVGWAVFRIDPIAHLGLVPRCLISMSALGLVGLAMYYLIPSQPRGEVRNSQSEPFSVIEGWSEAYSPQAGGLWFVQSSQITPISYAVLMTFTNRQNVPMMVASYILEVQTKNGDWERASLPFGDEGDFYSGQDIKAVNSATYKTLTEALQDKNIVPGETVRGWVFFVRWPPQPARMTLRTATGDTLTATIKMGGGPGWPTQSSEVAYKKTNTDLSKLPFSEEAEKVVLPPNPNPAPSIPPTVHDLFGKDFSQYMSAGRSLDVGSAEHPNQVKIEFKDFFNFAEQSEFLAVYVPKFNDCFGVCRFVASNCKNQIEEIHAIGKAQMSTPGDTAPVSTDDLVFSGRVFIYYEDDLSLEQLGVLEQEFKANGLSPQFRGQQYATTVWLQSGFKPPSSIPDKSAP